MNQFIQVLRRLLLAANWLVMAVIALIAFLGSLGNFGIWGFVGAAVSLFIALGIHKLINWVLLGSNSESFDSKDSVQ